MNKEEYIETGGTSCPFCGSGEIEGGFVEVNGGSAHQKIRCLLCGEEWHDIYKLIDIERVDNG